MKTTAASRRAARAARSRSAPASGCRGTARRPACARRNSSAASGSVALPAIVTRPVASSSRVSRFDRQPLVVDDVGAHHGSGVRLCGSRIATPAVTGARLSIVQRGAVAEASSPAASRSSARPWPGGAADASKPGPSSSTAIAHAAVGRGRAHARSIRLRGAATRRTSRCSRPASAAPGAAPDGRAASVADVDACTAADRRTARARCRDSRATILSSSSSGTSGVGVLSSDERSSDASWPVIRSAPAGSSWTSAAIEFSVLNRSAAARATRSTRAAPRRRAGAPPPRRAPSCAAPAWPRRARLRICPTTVKNMPKSSVLMTEIFSGSPIHTRTIVSAPARAPSSRRSACR